MYYVDDSRFKNHFLCSCKLLILIITQYYIKINCNYVPKTIIVPLLAKIVIKYLYKICQFLSEIMRY